MNKLVFKDFKGIRYALQPADRPNMIETWVIEGNDKQCPTGTTCDRSYYNADNVRLDQAIELFKNKK
jgi:hypothetical protein